MIRKATMGDLPGFMALAERFRERLVTYPDCPIDPQSVLHVFGRCVADASRYAMVAEHHGEITGALLGITQELWWSRAKEATDVMFHAEHSGDGLAMLMDFLAWAEMQPRVRVITLANSTGEHVEALTRFYEGRGLRRIGSLHQAVVIRRAKEEAA